MQRVRGSKIEQLLGMLYLGHRTVNGISLDYKEYFWCFYLTRANKVLGDTEIGHGSATGVVVNIPEIFVTALKTSAASLIVVHNHPSGTLKPSVRDKEITNSIKVSGDLLSIKLLDHLIITSESKYYSFADEGELSSNKIPF